MADPDLELDYPPTDPGGRPIKGWPPGPDTSITDPRKGSTLVSPDRPETGPQSKPLSSTAATAITSGTLRTAVSAEDKAAIAHLADPYRETTTAKVPEAKLPRSAGLNSALDARQKGQKAHAISQPRHYSDLGKPPPGTVQPPHAAEIPNVLNSIGEWFGQTNLGSGMLSILGRQAKEQTDGFIFARQKSTKNEQEIAYNKMINANLAVKSHVEGMLMDASEAMGGDPKTLTQRLVAVARKWHSPDLEFKATHGSAEDTLKWLTELDRRYQDLHASNTQLKNVEDITNANQDILNPRQDQPIKQPATDSGADSGAGGDPYAHQVIVEPVTPPETAAPTAQPTAQPPVSPPPDTPVAPAVPAGTAAPDAGQGGFVPNINAPDPGAQGALQPDQPVLVAGGGIEDVPRNWYEKMPQVAQAGAPPQPDDWQPPESHAMDGAVLETGQPVPRAAFRQIDDEAANAVMDPRTIQALGKDKNKRVHAGLVEKRANEIRDALGAIANNPNRGVQDGTDPRVLRDITKISPSLARLASIVKAVGDGTIPPPPRNQMFGQRAGLGQIIFPLVGKYDSTMLKPGVYEARAAGLKQFGPGGKLGQNALSVVTGAKHSGLYADDIAKWEQWGWGKQVGVGEAASIPGEGNLGLNRLLRMGGQTLMSPETQALEGSMDFNRDVVIRELERGYTGAAPHVHGLDQIIADLDWRNNRPEVVKGALARAVALLRERLDENMVMFDQTVGKDPASYMGKYIRSYVSKGQGISAGGEQVKPEDMGILDRMINDIKSGAAPRPAQSPSIDDVMRKYGG